MVTIKQKGGYDEERKDGYGIFEWPDGKKYKGYWKQGKRQGEGELYDPVEKVWKKGKWGNEKKEIEKDTTGSMLSIDNIK